MRKPIRKCFLSAYLWGNNKAGKSNWCLSLESDGRELGIPTTTMWVWTAYGKPNFHNMNLLFRFTKFKICARQKLK